MPENFFYGQQLGECTYVYTCVNTACIKVASYTGYHLKCYITMSSQVQLAAGSNASQEGGENKMHISENTKISQHKISQSTVTKID